MHIVVSTSIAFAIGVSVVAGLNYASAQPARVAAPQVASVQSDAPNPQNVPTWKACLIANAGSVDRAYREMMRLDAPFQAGRHDVFSPCLSEESKVLATMDKGNTEFRNHTIARALMLMDFSMTIR